jgi:hypothetical protein
VLFFFPGVEVSEVAESAVAVRVLRLMRVTWAARYVQSLRRCCVRRPGCCSSVTRTRRPDGSLRQILNRVFVFVPAAADVKRAIVEDDQRDVLFAALRREHELQRCCRRAAVPRLLLRRRRPRASAQALGRARGPRARVHASATSRSTRRSSSLWALRAQDVGRWLRPSTCTSLDRVSARVVGAARALAVRLVRSLCRASRLAGEPRGTHRAARRRVAQWLEGWHGGCCSSRPARHRDGPQILDRVASRVVKGEASGRPCGLLFSAACSGVSTC